MVPAARALGLEQLFGLPQARADEQDQTGILPLGGLLTEFPIPDAECKAVALSMFITPVIRGAMTVAPMHLVTAPLPASGKSYLIDDYIDSPIIVNRLETNFQLIFRVQEFEKFNDNIGFLRMDLSGFQEWYHSRGDYIKENAFEASQDLIDIFMRLMGNKVILDS